MGGFDKWLEVLSSLRRNKLRTLLTASGVFWGILMLVLMIGFGTGLRNGVERNMLGFMGNRVYVWGSRTSVSYAGFQPGRRIRLENADADLVQRELEGAVAVAPRLELGGWREGNNVTYQEKAGNFRVFGNTEVLSQVERFIPHEGRFLNEVDVAERRKVAVVGERVRDVLFSPGVPAVGRHISIRGVFFQVIGVFRSDKPGGAGERDNGSILMPLSTMQVAYNMPNAVGWLTILMAEDRDAVTAEQHARAILARRYRAHPEDASAIGSYNEGKQFQRFQRLFTGMDFFIWFVSVATMLAGALGVSNILMISVKERTKEIGLRKALGATPRAILSLVMHEATILTALSGYSGLVVGVAALELASHALAGSKGPVAAPSIDFGTALVATGLLLLMGFLAGMAPARHAASIQPADALRAG